MKTHIIRTPERLSTNPQFFGLVEKHATTRTVYTHDNGYTVSALETHGDGSQSLEVAVFDKQDNFTRSFFPSDHEDDVMRMQSHEVVKLNQTVKGL